MTRPLRIALAAFAVTASPLTGCDLVDIEDRTSPNSPTLEDVVANPNRANLGALGVGIESAARPQLGTYLVDVGVLGREYYRFSGSDPRFTADLLGRENALIDNNTFYITNPWALRYRNIRNANTMLQGVQANETLLPAERGALNGYAKTWKAYQYLLNVNLTFENGLRFIEPGEEDAGPIVDDHQEVLTRIAALLDEANADFEAGDDLFFATTLDADAGVDGYREINRALASRVALYRQDWEGALSALDGSFLDENGDLGVGAYHVFSTADQTNPAFFSPDVTGEALPAHPSYVTDIEEGDERISKVVERPAVTLDGLSSGYRVFVYESNTAPIPVVRNGELILNRAEARAQTGDFAGAIADVNRIRNASGLDDYDGSQDQDSVIDEILRQRRYELFAEGHRWIDARRYGRLGELPIDRAGDDVFDRFPIPQNDLDQP